MTAAVRVPPFPFLALDGLMSRHGETRRALDGLNGAGDFGLKVNLDYLLKNGLRFAAAEFTPYRRPVFFDLKAWNGKRTVRGLVRQCLEAGVAYVTVHALADAELDGALEEIAKAKAPATKLLATTVLTHYDEAYCQAHFRRSRAEAVRHFAEVARNRGCHGIVLPGRHLDSVADLPGLLRAVPGVRFAVGETSARNDPTAEVTPEEAAAGGADIIVCGSPVFGAEDPVSAFAELRRRLGHPV